MHHIRIGFTPGISFVKPDSRAVWSSRLLHRLASLKLLKINGAGPNRYYQLVDPGGLLDLWAAGGRTAAAAHRPLCLDPIATRILFKKFALLDEVSEHWALGGAAAANVYAPTLTVIPEPTVWFDARVPAERVARAIGGEIVDKGANLWLWQSEQDVALTHATLWKPLGTVAMESGELRIVTRARAYIEALKEGGRSAEIAQSLREKNSLLCQLNLPHIPARSTLQKPSPLARRRCGRS